MHGAYQLTEKNLRTKRKTHWELFYWLMILCILIALVFMVRFVLNSSKIMVDESMPIHPFEIDWGLERDGSLRVNDPFYLDADAHLFPNETIHLSPTAAEELQLKDLKYPYLIWKNKGSDTLHVIKNDEHFKFQLTED